jgi:hypothetical protein
MDDVGGDVQDGVVDRQLDDGLTRSAPSARPVLIGVVGEHVGSTFRGVRNVHAAGVVRGELDAARICVEQGGCIDVQDGVPEVALVAGVQQGLEARD